MRFCVAANRRFEAHARRCIDSVRGLGYDDPFVFDLGGLGFGLTHVVEDDDFHRTGCYRTGFTKWRSRGMHVPAVVASALEMIEPGDVLVYLDADTRLLERIDEIEAIPFAVAITVRPEDEWESLGRANSGVICFRRGEPALAFVREWEAEVWRTGSVQEGLNVATRQTRAHIHEFSTCAYNNYHATDDPPSGTKIIHYRASMSDAGEADPGSR
jgi:hypothetical protein